MCFKKLFSAACLLLCVVPALRMFSQEGGYGLLLDESASNRDLMPQPGRIDTEISFAYTIDSRIFNDGSLPVEGADSGKLHTGMVLGMKSRIGVFPFLSLAVSGSWGEEIRRYIPELGATKDTFVYTYTCDIRRGPSDLVVESEFDFLASRYPFDWTIGAACGIPPVRYELPDPYVGVSKHYLTDLIDIVTVRNYLLRTGTALRSGLFTSIRYGFSGAAIRLKIESRLPFPEREIILREQYATADTAPSFRDRTVLYNPGYSVGADLDVLFQPSSWAALSLSCRPEVTLDEHYTTGGGRVDLPAAGSLTILAGMEVKPVPEIVFRNTLAWGVWGRNSGGPLTVSFSCSYSGFF